MKRSEINKRIKEMELLIKENGFRKDEVNLVCTRIYQPGDRILLESEEKKHEIVFLVKQIGWLEINHMIKSEEASPFPALTQIEVYGNEI